MVDLLRKAFGCTGDVKQRPEGGNKGPLPKRLYGKVRIQVLFVVFDWKTFLYGGSDSLDKAVRAQVIRRVPSFNAMRSFELHMDKVCVCVLSVLL
jgi:hypothetical protein